MRKDKNSTSGDGIMAIAIIAGLIIIDQIIKILVKPNMSIGESLHITVPDSVYREQRHGLWHDVLQ